MVSWWKGEPHHSIERASEPASTHLLQRYPPAAQLSVVESQIITIQTIQIILYIFVKRDLPASLSHNIS